LMKSCESDKCESRELLIKKSTDQKIYKANTRRMIKLNSYQGLAILDSYGFDINYIHKYPEWWE